VSYPVLVRLDSLIFSVRDLAERVLELLCAGGSKVGGIACNGVKVPTGRS